MSKVVVQAPLARRRRLNAEEVFRVLFNANLQTRHRRLFASRGSLSLIGIVLSGSLTRDNSIFDNERDAERG